MKFFKPKFVQNLSVIYQLICKYLQLFQVQLKFPLNLLNLGPIENISEQELKTSDPIDKSAHSHSLWKFPSFANFSLTTPTDIYGLFLCWKTVAEYNVFYEISDQKRLIAGKYFFKHRCVQALYLDANTRKWNNTMIEEKRRNTGVFTRRRHMSSSLFSRPPPSWPGVNFTNIFLAQLRQYSCANKKFNLHCKHKKASGETFVRKRHA